ncbi:bZIP transcription factor 29 [Setaria viridis]
MAATMARAVVVAVLLMQCCNVILAARPLLDAAAGDGRGWQLGHDGEALMERQATAKATPPHTPRSPVRLSYSFRGDLGIPQPRAARAEADHERHRRRRRRQHGQQQLGVSLPMATSSFAPDAASAKPRPPGLPPTPPPASFAGHRPSPGDVCMDIDPAARSNKAHRRSRSDVPFGYFPPATSHLPPPKVEAGWSHHGVGGGGDADDLFNAYLNLEGLDGLNSSDERHDDGDSRGSGMKTNGADSSENESEECAADSRAAGIQLWGEAGAAGDRREGLKRRAAGDPAAATAPMPRHARSLSMDSLIGKLNFSAGAAANGVMPGPNRFSLAFGSGEFTPVEMKKIMADEKLAEMALADPKRVKR